MNVQIRAKGVIGSDASRRTVVSGSCLACGAMNQYSGPVVPIELSKNNQLLTSTNAGEWLIRRDVCSSDASQLLGDIYGEEWRGWAEILLETVSSQLHDLNIGLVNENPCTECEREGHFIDYSRPIKLVYDEPEFSNAGGNCWGSYELIGNSIFSDVCTVRACPLLYISGAMAAVLQDQNELDFCALEFMNGGERNGQNESRNTMTVSDRVFVPLATLISRKIKAQNERLFAITLCTLRSH